MATINKIRLTNIIYEDGDKRFNDEIFNFNSNNSAILLENGGGKTVFIHTVLQAVLPHTNLGDRKIKDTLQLANGPAHIGIEWIENDQPRHYVTTAVTLFMHDNQLRSYKYVYAYEEGNDDRLEEMPFVKNDGTRPATKEEMAEYFSQMKSKSPRNAVTFDTNKSFHEYIETNYQIITNEWESIVKINSDEGGIEAFFDHCKTTTDLFDRLLIPTVEDALSGHEEGKFADIFEEQREGFTMYRNLKNSMKEHALIQAEIEDYVEQFARYSEKEKSYELAKSRAKGMEQTLMEQATSNQAAQAKAGQALEDWQIAADDLKRQKASYDIMLEEARAKELEKTYVGKVTELEETSESLATNKAAFYNLSYAKEKENLQSYQQQEAVHEAALREKDEAGKVADLTDDLERVNEQIHGHFVSELEALEKNITDLTIEQRPLQDEKTALERKLKEEAAAKQIVKTAYDGRAAVIEKNEGDIETIKQGTLANPQQDDVQTEYDKWLKTQEKLEDDIITAKNTIHEKSKEKTTIEKELLASRKEAEQLRLQLQQEENEQAALNKAQQSVIDKLASVRAHWQGLDDIYLKQSSIEHSLAEIYENSLKKREDILLKERLAHRFTDDHDQQNHFFTDPFISQALELWQSDIVVLTGAEYVENLPESEQEAAKNYDLWAFTLVTTASDLPKLQTRLGQVQEQMQHPVTIVTYEEAKEIHGKEDGKRWIAPAHWEKNLDRQAFAEWKKSIKIEAEEASIARKEADDNVTKLSHIKDAVTQFFINYPKTYAENLRESIQRSGRAVERMKRTEEKLTNTLKQVEKDIEVARKEAEEKDQFVREVTDKLSKLQEIFRLTREITKLKAKQRAGEKELLAYDKKMKDLHREIERYETELALLADQISDNRQQIIKIKTSELYEEVKDARAKFTNQALAVMRERRETIRFEIRGIEQEHGEIRAKLEAAQDNISRTKDALDNIKDEFPRVDESFSFPVDGAQQIIRHRQAMRQGEEDIQRLREEVNEVKSAMDEIKGMIKAKMQQFSKDFPGTSLYPFTMDIEVIPTHLAEQDESLKENKQYIEETLRRIEKVAKDIAEASRKLENFKEAHHFHRSNVVAMEMTTDQATDFSYDRMKQVTRMTKTLTENLQSLEEEKERIDRAKRAFRNFCRKNITDRRLQESAIEGMDTKESYEEILTYREDMLIRLESADKVARTYIHNNDKDVQAFINNIHNHLRNVIAELEVIPTNTKVKTANRTVQIYKFTIPKWEDEKGKGQIRAHLDWILAQLESDHFKDDQGKEDTGKVRKQLERWLQTKTLLQVVMENERMRVSCRKVTNDNQITSRLSSWEQSNQWSGGEKWSKNMTLFLGILNFIAKKKHPAAMKRSRAVILDNPFGKASSDHVLNPVFYIAEQLGFQMIALTAHADGKFLQDYFPIIYSLKLREATNDGKQVMTKERHLHHAYFEDHAPEEMSRLEEREQMSFALDEE